MAAFSSCFHRLNIFWVSEGYTSSLGFGSICFFSVDTSLDKGTRIVTVGDYCLFSSITGAVVKEVEGFFAGVFGDLA